MLRKVALFAMVAAGVLVDHNTVRADFFTANGTVQVSSFLPPAGPPLNNIFQLGFQQGIVYTNTTSFGGGGNAVGNTVNSVGAIPLSTTTTFPSGTSGGINSGGNVVVAVFGVHGTVISDISGVQTAQFTTGKLAFYTTSSFSQLDPGTWGTSGTPLAVYDLAPQQNIFPGVGGDPIFFPASDVNISAANAATFVQTQGQFLFTENPSSNFIDVTSMPGLFGEGLFTVIDQTIRTPAAHAFTAAQQSVLNNFATFAGLPLGLGFGFANFGSGGATDYLPNLSPLTNGDFAATLGGRADPGVFSGTIIPEPITLAMFAGMMGIGGVIYRRRTLKAIA
jgi:hypothetical protein